MDSKIKKISEWVNEQGYPLEMYCENILTQNGFQVIQSLHYEDTETKKFREVDIVATMYKNYNGVTFNFSIVIECKLSKHKPWLLFARKLHEDHIAETHNLLFTTRNGILLNHKSPNIAGLSLLNYDTGRVGFNITECFTNGKDVPYQAVINTINACEYFVSNSNNSRRKFCNFYFPVVVIETEFYKCYTDGEGDFKIEKTEIEKLLTTRSYSERSSILHTIVTEEGFKQFAENLAIELNSLFDQLVYGFQYVSVERPSNSSYNIVV